MLFRSPEPIMPGSRSAAGSKADDREGSKPAVKGSEEIGGNKGRLSSKDSEVISSKRLDAAVRPTAGISKVEVPPLPSAPHKPAAHEVLITKGFKIDLTDEFFYPYRRADGFLLRGVENWLAANKRGLFGRKTLDLQANLQICRKAGEARTASRRV